MKVAIIHDWLTGMRGGEKVLESMCELYPEADIFTLIYNKEKVSDKIKKHKITASFLQHIPGVFKTYRNFLPLFTLAIESFNLGKYDLVLSSSHCVAKSVKTHKGTTHICYCHTPMRYAWSHFSEYFSLERTGRLKYKLVSLIMPWLRSWDVKTADRVTHYVANSDTVAARIKEYYKREAVTIYPPVDTDFYKAAPETIKEDFYLMVSALTEYKKVDFAINVFNKLKDKKLVIIGTGPLFDKLKATAGPNISMLGFCSNAEILAHYRKAKAFIFPGEEDFGITVVEAQACGTPVLAFHKGGAVETVVAGVTGEFFDGTQEDFVKTLEKMDKTIYNGIEIRKNSEKFSRQIFEKKYFEYVQKAQRENTK